MCVTDRHDMTSAVKVALNPNTTNNQSKVVVVLCNSTIICIGSQDFELYSDNPCKIPVGSVECHLNTAHYKPSTGEFSS